MDLYKFIGIAGLVLICLGLAARKRTSRDILSFFGGLGLLAYSIYLKDFIFILLQTVYIAVAAVDFIKEKRRE